MINIRYHIVSITAIFLALGIGTLLGSTFLERATVEQLDTNIRNAENRINETQAINADLQRRVDAGDARDRALIEASDGLLDGQLTGLPVLLVVAPGVDRGTVDTVRRILVNADAEVEGSLTLREGLTFADGVDGELADALGLETDDPEAARDEVTDRLVAALVAAGAPADPEAGGEEEPAAGTTSTVPVDPTTADTTPTTVAPTSEAPTSTTPTDSAPATEAPTTEAPTTVPEGSADPGAEDPADGAGDPTAPEGQQPEVLTALIEADLVGLDPGPANTPDDPLLERTGYQYVFVSQPGLDDTADDLLLGLLPPEQTDPPLQAVVVSRTVPEPADGEDPQSSAVTRVRTDPARGALYDTVDDIDTYLGLSSMVTVLRADPGAAPGHYGQGDGATALAPAGR